MLEVERVFVYRGEVLSCIVGVDVRVVDGDKVSSRGLGDGDLVLAKPGDVVKHDDTEVDGDAMGVKHSLPVALGLREILALAVTEPVPLGLFEIRGEEDIVLLPRAEGESVVRIVCVSVTRAFVGETEILNVSIILVEGEPVVELE